MKRILVLLILLILPAAVSAKVPVSRANNLPQGVFKKTWNGNIVQYDNNGRKTHTYKMKNGKIVGIK